MLVPLLLHITNLLGELLNGVLVCAVLHLKICAHLSVCLLFYRARGENSPCCFFAAAPCVAMMRVLWSGRRSNLIPRLAVNLRLPRSIVGLWNCLIVERAERAVECVCLDV